MKKFTIYYSNGYFETTNNINVTFLHFLEIGLIKIIFCNEEGKAHVGSPTEKGLSVKVKVPEIQGL